MQTTVADAVLGPQAEAGHPSIKVLLIEDNPLDVRLIGIMLRDSAPGLLQLE